MNNNQTSYSETHWGLKLNNEEKKKIRKLLIKYNEIALGLVKHLGLKINNEEEKKIGKLLINSNRPQPYTAEQLDNLKQLINLKPDKIKTADDFIKHCKENCPLINSLFRKLSPKTSSKEMHSITKNIFFEEMNKKGVADDLQEAFKNLPFSKVNIGYDNLKDFDNLIENNLDNGLQNKYYTDYINNSQLSDCMKNFLKNMRDETSVDYIKEIFCNDKKELDPQILNDKSDNMTGVFKTLQSFINNKYPLQKGQESPLDKIKTSSDIELESSVYNAIINHRNMYVDNIRDKNLKNMQNRITKADPIVNAVTEKQRHIIDNPSNLGGMIKINPDNQKPLSISGMIRINISRITGIKI